MRGKPEEAAVGARAASSQRFSLGVFKFIVDHSFAFVHCQVVLGNATSLGSRCTKKCSSSNWRKTYGCWWRAQALSFFHLASKTKSATALILVGILALVCYTHEEVTDPTASFPGSFFFVSRERKRGWERGCRLDANAVWEISLPTSPYCNLQMLFTFRWGGTGVQSLPLPVPRSPVSRTFVSCSCYSLFVEGG